jgi:hypothetical protein
MTKKTEVEFVIVPYPKIPLEGIYVERRLGRIRSKHIRDLQIAFVFALVATFSIWVAIVPLSKLQVFNSQVLAALITAGLASSAALFHLAKNRFSTVDVFSSEILARLRILAADDTIQRISQYADPEFMERRLELAGETQRSFETVLKPSDENYFANFHQRSEDLGALSSLIVDHVTDFYSFQMAARDALRSLTSTIDMFPLSSDEIGERVVDVIFMLDLMAYSGMRALGEMIEIEEHKWHSYQIALSIGTAANEFLLNNMNREDRRFDETLHRREQYSRVTTILIKKISGSLVSRRLNRDSTDRKYF